MVTGDFFPAGYPRNLEGIAGIGTNMPGTTKVIH